MKKYRYSFHLIEVHYIGATNFRGSRVKIHSARFKKTVYLSYSYKHASMEEQAVEYLEEKGFKIEGVCEMAKGIGLLSSTFKEL